MFLSKFFRSKVNYNQTPINKQLLSFIKDNKLSIDTEGYLRGNCSGYTVLFLMAMELEVKKLSREVEDIDAKDMQWFSGILTAISKNELSSIDQKILIDFVTQLDFFQNSWQHTNIRQGDLSLILQNSPRHEYLFIGQLSKKDLLESNRRIVKDEMIIRSWHPSLFEILIQEHRLIYLRSVLDSYSHASAIYRHDNIIYYYDCNDEAGALAFKQEDFPLFADYLIKTLGKNGEIKIGFNIFSSQDDKIEYPNIDDLLNLYYKENSDIYCLIDLAFSFNYFYLVEFYSKNFLSEEQFSSIILGAFFHSSYIEFLKKMLTMKQEYSLSTSFSKDDFGKMFNYLFMKEFDYQIFLMDVLLKLGFDVFSPYNKEKTYLDKMIELDLDGFVLSCIKNAPQDEFHEAIVSKANHLMQEKLNMEIDSRPRLGSSQ